MHIVISNITGCVSISGFASLSSAIGLKNCVITAPIKRHKWINKKNTKEHDKTVLLAKSQLNRIKFLISKAALIDSNVCHDEFVLINNVLK